MEPKPLFRLSSTKQPISTMKTSDPKMLFHTGPALATKYGRRRFIRSFAVGTAVSTLLGKGWLGTLLADCRPTLPGDGVLRVNVADFPALAGENGSVRLAFNPFTVSGPSGPFYPILINRGANNRFYTLSTQCQHQFCVVPPFNASAGASTCPCHGSQYSIDGSVLRGPTTKPLIAYSNSFDGSTLCVEIPNLGFALTGLAMQSASGPRFQLSFRTKSNVKYQVVFRQDVSDNGAVIPFATTSDGNATSMALKGNGSTATVFVDRTAVAGFYSVTVQVTQG
jgi:nitrite reductase/ring-hydroxylating ferredoxin subunit